MELSNIPQFIQENEDLNLLLNQKEIYFYSDFSGEEYGNDALKAHTSHNYYNTFKEIYKTHINAKGNAKLIPLLKSVNFLATPEVQSKIINEFIEPELQSANNALLEIKKHISKQNAEDYLVNINKPLSTPVVEMINQFRYHDELKELTESILITALDICDEATKTDPTDDVIRFAAYSATINKLKKVKTFDHLQERYDRHRKRTTETIEDADNKYYIWLILGILVFVIRLLMRAL